MIPGTTFSNARLVNDTITCDVSMSPAPLFPGPLHRSVQVLTRSGGASSKPSKGGRERPRSCTRQHSASSLFCRRGSVACRLPLPPLPPLHCSFSRLSASPSFDLATRQVGAAAFAEMTTFLITGGDLPRHCPLPVLF